MLESPCETNKCNNTSAEIEMLDSHEAMNSREVHENIREKRNYEFLMSLINNNSKYEVAGISTPTVAKKKEVSKIIFYISMFYFLYYVLVVLN